MKPLFVIVILFVVKFSYAQNITDSKARIDAVINSFTKKSYDFLSANIQTLKGTLKYNISYSFRKKKSPIVKITRQFSHNNDSISQTFYAKDEELLYAKELILSYYSSDSISWSGDFYFSDNKLIDYTTLGHGKSETDTWNPEVDILDAFKEARQDLEDYMNGDDAGSCVHFGKSTERELIFYARQGMGIDSVYTYQDYLVVTNYVNRTMTVDSFTTLAKNYIDTANHSDTLIGSVIFLRQEPNGCLQEPTENYLANTNRIEKFGIIEVSFQCGSPDRKGKLNDMGYINIWKNGKYDKFIYADNASQPINNRDCLIDYLDSIIDN